MLNEFVIWLCAHPLQFVGGLIAFSGAVGLLLIPKLHELHDHGHPRC
jgi:hypothetical protein